VINGDITVTIGSVELLSLKVNLVIASLETAKRYGLRLPWEQEEKPKKRTGRMLTSSSQKALR
jgi:hypothetical protein